jgi:hypothetical protein
MRDFYCPAEAILSRITLHAVWLSDMSVIVNHEVEMRLKGASSFSFVALLFSGM